MARVQKPVRIGKAAAGSAGPGGWRRGALSAVLVIGVAAAVVGVGWIGFRALWDYVISLEEFSVDMEKPNEAIFRVRAIGSGPADEFCRFEDLDWVRGGEFRAELAKSALLRGSRSLFCRGLAARVAEACSESPWVRPVSVKRRFPKELRIRLEIRRPFAVVQAGGKEALVDRDQFVLKQALYVRPELPPIRLGWPAIPPDPGARWDDARVAGGVEMLALLVEHGLLDSETSETPIAIDRIEISRKGLVKLCAPSGAVLEWGRPPNEMPPKGAVTTEHKLRSLVGAAGAFGPRLDREPADYFKLYLDPPRWRPKKLGAWERAYSAGE